jgi:hypothetical protein
MLTTANNFLTENIFSISSEEELAQAFRIRDQKKLIIPANFTFPMNVRSYLTWQEPSGVYTYLVFKSPNWDSIRGVAFKRPSSDGEPTGGLCNWCHAYGSSEEIGMLTVAMSAEITVGYHICKDLRCVEKIEEATALAGKHPEKAIDQLYQKISRMFENMKGYT